MAKKSTKPLSYLVLLAFAFATILGGSQLPAASAETADQAPVDLIAGLTVPNQGVTGETFEISGEITNVGPSTADGASFVLDVAPGTYNLAATCETVQGGAVCPTDLALVQATASENGRVTGTVPTLPANSKIVLRVTGLYTALNSTARTSLTVTAPNNTVDADPSSNVAVQNTALTKVATAVQMSVQQSATTVNLGEESVYNISYENTGSTPAVVELYGVYRSRSANTAAKPVGTVNVSVATVCDSETTITCPAVFNGQQYQQQITWSEDVTLFDGSAAHATEPNPYKSGLGYVILPPGKKLVLKSTVIHTLQGCIKGGDEIAVYSFSRATWPAGVGAQFPDVQQVSDGRVRGTECEAAEVTVTKTQDKATVDSGETRTYKVTYENTGALDADVNIYDSYLPKNDYSEYYPRTVNGVNVGVLTGEGTLQYSVSCDSESTVPCPSVFDGKQVTLNNNLPGYNRDVNLFITSSPDNEYWEDEDEPLNDYQRQLRSVTIPAGQKLVLRIPVKHTLEGCIRGGNHIDVTNTASGGSAQQTGADLNINRAELVSLVRGDECVNTTIKITKTQDKNIVESGETRNYTVIYENTGSHDAEIGLQDKYSGNGYSYQAVTPAELYRYDRGSLSGKTTVKFAVNCDSAESTMPCPSMFNQGEVTETAEYVSLYRTASPQLAEGHSYLDKHGHIKIPAGKKLVLRIPVTQTVEGCVVGSQYLAVSNDAGGYHQTGVTIVEADSSESRINGLVRGTECPKITVTKTQDREVVNSDEERNYTITYENTGTRDASVKIEDSYRVDSSGGVVAGKATTRNPGRAEVSYRVYCDEASTAPCPEIFNGTEYKTRLTGSRLSLIEVGDRYVSQENHPYMQRGNEVLIPAGKKLILRIPFKHTLENCIDGRDYVGVANEVRTTPGLGATVDRENESRDISGAVNCNDVSSITEVAGGFLQFGEQLRFSSKITNAAGSAERIPFSQVLPKRAVLTPEQLVTAGLITDPAAAYRFSCFTGSGATATPEAVTCPADLRYDPEKHAITGTYTGALGSGSWFQIVTETFAGFVAAPSGSFEIKTELGTVPGDTNPTLNNSSRAFEVTNTAGTIRAVHTLNVTAPADIQLRGKLFCELHGDANSQPRGFVTEYQAVLKKGSDTATTVVHSGYWIHDNCRIELDRGEPPRGFVWDDSDWESVKSQTKNNVAGSVTWQFPLQIAAGPFAPELPHTGGVSDAAYLFVGGFIAALSVVAAAIVRRVRLRGAPAGERGNS